ncbi:BTB/POZ domain-containing protein KCTD9-like [Neopelma chrysocephalum]|uniref:BTB/POZ domain-containing protein KCTD9-like n=1 Tax=Neopelma chrysocephalum TaxID=114329 RepID=UPI000FCCE3F4|nr:BTB/POZ domain-containing protein KCTD9-like [Neopelma chrysocephalum]
MGLTAKAEIKSVFLIVFGVVLPALSDSCLCQCANLPGVKMLRSNAEGASLKGCNSEDPSGLKAHLEGANLKGVAMEGSQMTGINLRVAKSAGNLGDCWLLADLSSFRVQWSSGCDL